MPTVHAVRYGIGCTFRRHSPKNAKTLDKGCLPSVSQRSTLGELFTEPLVLADQCIILGPELLPADQESAELIRAIVGATRPLIG